MTIKKYQTRPVEAVQYTGHNATEIESWAQGKVIPSPVLEPTDSNPSGAYLQVNSRDGWVTAIPTDWVIRDHHGEIQTCRAGVFEWAHREDRSEELQDIVEAALRLRNSGYDGPFMGDATVELFAALARLE
jgi:hypothetical protein